MVSSADDMEKMKYLSSLVMISFHGSALSPVNIKDNKYQYSIATEEGLAM